LKRCLRRAGAASCSSSDRAGVEHFVFAVFLDHHNHAILVVRDETLTLVAVVAAHRTRSFRLQPDHERTKLFSRG